MFMLMSGLGNSAKQLVVAQNRKLPRILPWGEPPGANLGVDLDSLILTDIVLPWRKAATHFQALICCSQLS